MRLSSTVILSHLDKEIMLIKRKTEPFKDYWALVGGAKRNDESFSDCAVREVHEEVGVCLRGVTHVDTILVDNQLGEQFSEVFVAWLRDEDLPRIKIGSEVVEAKMFSPLELPPLIVPFHKEVIERWARLT